MRWELDNGPCDNHIVEFDGQWWGYENVHPREAHPELFAALKGGVTTWRGYRVIAIQSASADRSK